MQPGVLAVSGLGASSGRGQGPADGEACEGGWGLQPCTAVQQTDVGELFWKHSR